ncbi:MAG: 4-alpha-glucanotransferase [Lachnospiraceae bacterium]|nr:4-alpha-glucanotransferase [Lachnospiraceae bacterium]
MMKPLERGAGILMPISSFPSLYGIGTMGKDAYAFVDFLRKSHHHYWQVLPLGPTSFGDSPYQGPSTFAGNPYFIDLETLIEEGLLTKEYVESFDWGDRLDKCLISYDKLFEARYEVLRTAFTNSKHKETKEYQDFLRENADWLEDYALFMAVKLYHKNADWSIWKDDIRFRKPGAVERYRDICKTDVEFFSFLQFKFFEQWNRLKKYANDLDIEIIGDVPIYVAFDSADVWSNAKEFLLDENLTPTKVAGVPPDAFSDLGQKWGNPLYDWKKMEENHFDWWRRRITAATKLYDVIRIDHFLGIAKYYMIPAEDEDARKGEYAMGPGQKLLDVVNAALGEKKLIAEDLGVHIPEASKLLEENHYPGMKVLEFAFGGDRKNEHLPMNYRNPNCVVYGGTHDNETLLGFLKDRDDWELRYAYDYLGTRDKLEMVTAMLRLAYGSIGNVVIFQVQDLLRQDNFARMNFPSTMGSNWRWRMWPGALGEKELMELAFLAYVFDRELHSTKSEKDVELIMKAKGDPEVLEALKQEAAEQALKEAQKALEAAQKAAQEAALQESAKVQDDKEAVGGAFL